MTGPNAPIPPSGPTSNGGAGGAAPEGNASGTPPTEHLVAEFRRRMAELDAREAEIMRREHEVAQYARIAGADDADSEAVELIAWRKQLEEREAELGRRRASVDMLYRQAAEARDAAQHDHAHVVRLRDELAAREAELRRAALEFEVDRERFDSVGGAAGVESLADAIAAAEAEPRPMQAAEALPAARSRFPWLRALFLSLLAGSGVAFAWLNHEPPRVRSAISVTTRGDRAVAEHAKALHSPDDVAKYFKSQTIAAEWATAVADGRAAILPHPEQSSLELRLDGADRNANESLLQAAIAAYSAALEHVQLSPEDSPAWREWDMQRRVLANEKDTLTREFAAIEQRRSAQSGAATWDQARGEVDRVRDELKSVTNELAQQRTTLAGLQAEQVPRGTVSTEQFAAALARDPVYEEDTRELEARAREYRAELAMSMLLAGEPLDELRKVARTCIDEVAAQRDLRPSAAIGLVLDKCSEELSDFDAVLAEAIGGWRDLRQQIERANVVEQIVELVTAQNNAIDAGGRIITESQRVIDELTKQADTLTDRPDAGTREQVVAAVIRGETSRVQERLTALTEATRKLDPMVNFKLDASDRQLRGLRVRVRERRDRVQDELQKQADEIASQDHDRRLREATDQVAELDRRREELAASLVDSIEALRDVENQSGVLLQLNAERAAVEASTTRVDEQLQSLAQNEPQPVPPTITPGEIRHTTIVVDRERNAAIAGSGAFGFVWVIALLLQSRTRRPRVKPSLSRT